MNRARWIISAATFLAFWLIGAVVLAPGLSGRLETAAQAALAGEGAPATRLSKVAVTFEGQEARLTGEVRKAEDREAAVAIVRERVRAPAAFGGLGMGLNPVAEVHDEIEISPYPAGWLMLATAGLQARLTGDAASEYEARDLARSLQETWSAQGGTVQGMPEVDPGNHDEAMNVTATLRGAPAPQAEAAMHITRIGGPWLPMLLDHPDEALRAQALVVGISDEEWRKRVLPALQEVRTAHEEQRRAAKEKRRVAALPPGHLFVAARDAEVTLRGELATEAAKSAVLDQAIAVFAPNRVNDEIRVSPRRRAGGELAPLTTALLPPKEKSPGKTLFLGIDNEAWREVDWQVAEDAQPWKGALPASMGAALLKEDSVAVIGWLQGAAKQRPHHHTQPAFITLTLFNGKAVLAGQMAEEATRTQIIAAARQAYAALLLVEHDDLILNGECEPFHGLLHLLKSLPPPPSPDSDGLFALTRPGESWTVLPVTRDLVEAGGLDRTDRLPKELSAALIEERSMNALEQLRAWLIARHPLPFPR